MTALDHLFPTGHNRDLPVALLQKLQRAAYWRFYTKPRNLWNLGRKLTNRRNVSRIVRAVSRLVFGREVVGVN